MATTGLFPVDKLINQSQKLLTQKLQYRQKDYIIVNIFTKSMNILIQMARV